MKKVKVWIKARLLYLRDSLVLWSNNRKIEELINRRINAPITEDEKSVIDHMIKHARPVRTITRKGRELFAMPLLTQITFGQYLDAREAANKGDVQGMIQAYGKFKPTIIGDMITASAWVVTQLRLAESVELESLGGSDGSQEPDEDTAILNMLQCVAEVYRIPTLEARNVMYEDALKALIKNKQDYDRQIAAMRRAGSPYR